MNKIGIEIKWALLFLLMQILWMTMERFTGLHSIHIDKHYIVTNLIAIPSILFYVLALLEKRKKDFNGKMNYQQGLITGLIITGIVTLFSPLVQWLISNVISPDYFSNMIAYTVAEGKMSQEEAEAYFNLRSYIIQVLIGTPVMGMVTTLIVAIFTRRR
jgi:ascorbate-specific PTS system EIIC-type component UlaA